MSCRNYSTLNYSLNEFAQHGGVTHSNKSGWGIAYYYDNDALLIKEPEPAADSPWIRFISEQQLQSDCVIAHVRLATIGTPSHRNTHPFKRELGGHAHIFAHNGTLKALHDEVDKAALRDLPIGETDSELAFCVLLQRMRELYQDTDSPELAARVDCFTGFCHDMAKLGSANFLYSDGEYLYAHGHRRIYEENGEFTEPKAPGLSIRNCIQCQEGEEGWYCNGLNIELGSQQTVLFASVPLDAEGWFGLDEGTVVAVSQGQVMYQQSSA